MADKSDLPMLAVKRPLLVGVLNLLIVIAGLAACYRPVVERLRVLRGCRDSFGEPFERGLVVTSVKRDQALRI